MVPHDSRQHEVFSSSIHVASVSAAIVTQQEESMPYSYKQYDHCRFAVVSL